MAMIQFQSELALEATYFIIPITPAELFYESWRIQQGRILGVLEFIDYLDHQPIA